MTAGVAAEAARVPVAPSCSTASTTAGEPLAGTATRAADWLVIERRGAWGRDAVADTELPAPVRDALTAFPGRVLLARRPDRRASETLVFRARTLEEGGALEQTTVASTGTEPEAEPAALVRAIEAATMRAGAASTHADPGADTRAAPLRGPLLLVCAHGRRDACCARLGVPVFDALAAHVEPALLWQSSHHGGHRFAANVLALPAGVQLGRVAPAEAALVALLLAEGRIPLGHYRGRTLYEPHVQAAEVAVRVELGLDRLADLALRGDDGERVSFRHPGGELTVTVERGAGPAVPMSCGDEPEETVAYSVRW